MSSAKIHIERASGGWVDRARAYDVIIDDEPCAKLVRGGCAEIEVEGGKHVVYLRLDWCRSLMLELNLEPGAETQLRCWPRSPLTVLYGMTFGRTDYMRLKSL